MQPIIMEHLGANKFTSTACISNIYGGVNTNLYIKKQLLMQSLAAINRYKTYLLAKV
jgi:hypothetical protein